MGGSLVEDLSISGDNEGQTEGNRVAVVVIVVRTEVAELYTTRAARYQSTTFVQFTAIFLFFFFFLCRKHPRGKEGPRKHTRL